MAINPFIGQGFSNYGYQDRMRGVFGGEKTYIDPYTTGYHMIFIYPPTSLETECGPFLTTVCQSVTVPGYTVNTIEYNGLNNKKWGVPGTVELDSNRLTCKFTEMAGLPITQIMGKWVSIFRNPLYGISDPDTSDSASQGAYKGKIVYATTLPDHMTVQFAAVFIGVMPLKIPTDIYTSDRATQDKVEPEIEFWFDDMFTGTSVISLARSLVQSEVSSSQSAVDSIYSNEVV